MSDVFSKSDNIREDHLASGINSLKSRIKGMDIEVTKEVIKEDEKSEPKYTKIEIANNIYDLYKDKVAPCADPKEEIPVANTQASRGNARALARSLAGIRNAGNAGPITHFTQQANGDVNPGYHCNNYAALVVAGTEMTMEEYEEYVKGKFGVEELEEKKGEDKKKGRCWTGYKPTPGKEPYSDGSCMKEDAVSELKDKLMALENTSWQSIDKVMRVLAKEHNITPKELHKQFKAENGGQIPDEWIKENRMIEEAGFMPLTEAVALNRVGNVYEVTGMWHAHTRRIKFFLPIVGTPTRDQMQEYFEMFYPGGKVISYYPSTHPGDNTKNEIVVVVPMKEEWVQLEQRSWEMMSDAECAVYEMIIAEEGEPTSPPMIADDGKVELWIADHDTGEERVVIFEGRECEYNKIRDHFKVWPSAYTSNELIREDDMKGMTVKSGHKRSAEQGAGLTEKGAAAYRRKNPGSKLQTAVTTPPSKLKPGSKAAGRRKSFCARSRGWDGERGKAARRRWNC